MEQHLVVLGFAALAYSCLFLLHYRISSVDGEASSTSISTCSAGECDNKVSERDIKVSES